MTHRRGKGKKARVQAVFGQHSSAHGSLGWSCAGPGDGFKYPCESLPTWDILWFYDQWLILPSLCLGCCLRHPTFSKDFFRLLSCRVVPASKCPFSTLSLLEFKTTFPTLPKKPTVPYLTGTTDKWKRLIKACKIHCSMEREGER